MIAACVKWIDDRSTHGLSAADEAAIEMALRHGEATANAVIAVTVGRGSADRCLRVALGCGVKTAIRIDAPNGMESASVALPAVTTWKALPKFSLKISSVFGSSSTKRSGNCL